MYKVQSESHVVSTQAFSPSSNATVTVNGIQLDPVPFVSLSVEQFTAADMIIGGVLNVNLNGTVYAGSGTGSGFTTVVGEINTIMDSIGGQGDCITITIECGGVELVNGHGVVTAVSVDEGPDPTFVQVAKYSVAAKLYVNKGDLAVTPNSEATEFVTTGEIVTDISESISLDLSEGMTQDLEPAGSADIGKHHAKYTFSISATGAAVGCKSKFSQKTGVDAAEEVVKRRIAQITNLDITSSLYDAAQVDSELSAHNGGKYLHVRTLNVDTIGGKVSVSGELIVRPNTCQAPEAFISLNIDVKKDLQTLGDVVTISGTVEGLHQTTFNNLITSNNHLNSLTNKMGNAESAFNTIKGNFLTYAQNSIGNVNDVEDSGDCTAGSLLGICDAGAIAEECTLREISASQVKNYGQGQINFNHEFSTEKICEIAGATKVETEVTRNYPTDVFAEFTIPFRGEPLLQDLGTTTKETVAVNITVTVNDVGCDEVDMSVVQGCALSKAEELEAAEGASAWFLTSYSVSRTNTGDLRLSREKTKNYVCS